MFLVLFITVICIFLFVRLLIVFHVPIQFFMTGQDKGFKISEILLLWKLANEAEIKEPLSLFISVPTLNMAISKIVMEAKEDGTETLESKQNFIAKLYEYRTKIDLEHQNKKGLDSTKYLEKGQRLRIILKGKGIFVSEILSVGYELIIRLPLQNNVRVINESDWVTKNVSVYLWRKGDAGYVFDTRVTNAGTFQGQSVIYLAHTNQLERAQKRRSIRAACKIYAQLYFINSEEEPDYEAIEVESGYKCLLEDISEDGAMIRIGGRGRQNIKIKIQFDIDDRIIIMYGIIRAVEYNAQTNQSRLHFECLHIEKDMRNKILEFIYRDLSDEKKEELAVLAEVEKEGVEAGDVQEASNSKEEESKEPASEEKPEYVDTESQNASQINENEEVKAEEDNSETVTSEEEHKDEAENVEFVPEIDLFPIYTGNM